MKLNPRNELPAESTYYSPAWHSKVDEATGTELTQGNELKLLSNGASYQRKLELVKASQKSISISVMTFLCESASRVMIDALAERAAAGVKIKIISEGSWTHIVARSCAARLRDAGVEVIKANDLT